MNAGENTYIIVCDSSKTDDDDDEEDDDYDEIDDGSESESEVETTIIETFKLPDDFLQRMDSKDSAVEKESLQRTSSSGFESLNGGGGAVHRVDSSGFESTPEMGHTEPISPKILIRQPTSLSESDVKAANASTDVTVNLLQNKPWKKKKRRAPPPPTYQSTQGSPMSLRHSYGGLHSYRCSNDSISALRNSTDTDSIASETHLFHQASTDSEQLDGLTTHYPGDLAGVESVRLRSPRIDNIRSDSPNDTSGSSGQDLLTTRSMRRSPRDRSTFRRLQDAFRSPQLGRRKSKKEKSGGLEKSPKMKKDTLWKKSSTEEGSSKSPRSPRGRKSESPRSRKSASFEPLPAMSDWILGHCPDDLEQPDQEFEVSDVTCCFFHMCLFS